MERWTILLQPTKRAFSTPKTLIVSYRGRSCFLQARYIQVHHNNKTKKKNNINGNNKKHNNQQ